MKLRLKYKIYNYHGFKYVQDRFELKYNKFPYPSVVGQNNSIIDLKVIYKVSNERMFKWY